MIEFAFTVPAPLAEQKLQTVVERMLPHIPSQALREAFLRRDVKVDKVRTARETRVAAGSEVKVYLFDACAAYAPSIQYEDERLLVIDKPAGVSCEADAKGGLTIGELLQSTYPGRFSIPPMPCHRLDNPTDGLLILAKDETTLALMTQAFHERQVQKQYTCLVRGEPSPKHATLQAYLVKDAANAKVYVTEQKAHGSLTIATEYEVLQTQGEVTRLLVTLHTGRTHQIRAHMAYIGHPLLGDDKYGDRAFNRAQRAKRLMLTATSLRFALTGELSYLNALRLTLQPKF